MNQSHDRDWTREWPDWIVGLRYLLSARSQFVLTGNIRDDFRLFDGSKWIERPILEVLRAALALDGYDLTLVYDYGRKTLDCAGTETRALASAITGLAVGDLGKPITLKTLFGFLPCCVKGVGEKSDDGGGAKRIAVVIDYASRIALDPQHLTSDENAFFLCCEKLANSAEPIRKIAGQANHAYNPIIWLVNRELDLPIWFVADNPKIHSLVIPLADENDRQLVARLALSANKNVPDEQGLRTLVDLTDGLPLLAIRAIWRVAQTAGLKMDSRGISEAVRTYKLGVHRNPWAAETVHAKLRAARGSLLRDVKGQEGAVEEVLARLKRSAMGLSGAHASPNSKRPRGVMLFAGPTGVGKTELVRAVTRHIFGAEDACIRFDMSEFSAEHSDQRLLGAPPGYVGYDSGGELTNAVRARPFSVLLFDEIEKAHMRIMDKFLQILEDGRLTDGRGNTVYFSECLIFFTTNLGISEEVEHKDDRDRETRVIRHLVTADTNPHEMRTMVRHAIAQHFKFKMNRPELLNRIGNENIVVFDFVADPKVVHDIMNGMIERVVARLAQEHSIRLVVSDTAKKQILSEACEASRENGGRGIGNKVEAMLVNPLAVSLFDGKSIKDGTVKIAGISQVASLEAGHLRYQLQME